MMAFFDLLKMGSYNHFPDSYAVNRKTLYQLFKPTLLEQLNRHKTVILSLHFPEEFFVVQDQLSQWNLDYQLITRTLDHQWFLENNSDASGLTPRLYLSLAEFLIETKFTGDELSETSLALMVLDRHPAIGKDESLTQFADGFPGKSEIGYFLSFEDEVVTRLIDERLLDLLLQMGANDHGLIASSLLSKRLKKMQRKEAHTFLSPEQMADSARQWYDLNVPPSESR